MIRYRIRLTLCDTDHILVKRIETYSQVGCVGSALPQCGRLSIARNLSSWQQPGQLEMDFLRVICS